MTYISNKEYLALQASIHKNLHRCCIFLDQMGFLDKRQEHIGYSKTNLHFFKVLFFLQCVSSHEYNRVVLLSKTSLSQTADVLISPHCSAKPVLTEPYGWIGISEVPAFRGIQAFSCQV